MRLKFFLLALLAVVFAGSAFGQGQDPHYSPNGCEHPSEPHWHWREIGVNSVGPPLLNADDLEEFLSPGPSGEYDKPWQVLWTTEGPFTTEDLEQFYTLAVNRQFVTSTIQPCEVLEDMMAGIPPFIVTGPNGERLRTVYDPLDGLPGETWELPSLVRATTGGMEVLSAIFVRGCSNPTYQVELAVEAPEIPVGLIKLNDASGDGEFHQEEETFEPGRSVQFNYTVTNESEIAIRITDFLDSIPGLGTVAVCRSLVGAVLQPNEQIVCAEVLDGYAPQIGSDKTNVAFVTVEAAANPAVTGQAEASSTVRTVPPPLPPLVSPQVTEVAPPEVAPPSPLGPVVQCPAVAISLFSRGWERTPLGIFSGRNLAEWIASAAVGAGIGAITSDPGEMAEAALISAGVSTGVNMAAQTLNPEQNRASVEIAGVVVVEELARGQTVQFAGGRAEWEEGNRVRVFVSTPTGGELLCGTAFEGRQINFTPVAIGRQVMKRETFVIPPPEKPPGVPIPRELVKPPGSPIPRPE